MIIYHVVVVSFKSRFPRQLILVPRIGTQSCICKVTSMLHAREIFIGISCRQKLSLEFGRDNAQNWLIHLLKLSEKLHSMYVQDQVQIYISKFDYHLQKYSTTIDIGTFKRGTNSDTKRDIFRLGYLFFFLIM